MSLNLNSSDISSSYNHAWHMGATSSCINDIANDDFVPILNIDEVSDEENPNSTINKRNYIIPNYNKLSVPAIHESASNHSISNILDFLDTSNENTNGSLLAVPLANTPINSNEMKSSGSDVSISYFLDREQFNEIYDGNNSASVNSAVPYRKKSNSNVSFKLDE